MHQVVSRGVSWKNKGCKNEQPISILGDSMCVWVGGSSSKQIPCLSPGSSSPLRHYIHPAVLPSSLWPCLGVCVVGDVCPPPVSPGQ